MGSILDFLFGEIEAPNGERLKRLDQALETVPIIHTNQLIMWAILTRMEWRLNRMATNWDEFDADLDTLVSGFIALKAQNSVLQDAVDNASKATQEAVRNALDENDAADQAKIDAAVTKMNEGGISRPDVPTDSDVDPNGGTTPDAPSSEAPPEVQANPPAAASEEMN